MVAYLLPVEIFDPCTILRRFESMDGRESLPTQSSMAGFVPASLTKRQSRSSGMAKKLFDSGTFKKARAVVCFLTEKHETELGVALNGVRVIQEFDLLPTILNPWWSLGVSHVQCLLARFHFKTFYMVYSGFMPTSSLA